MSVTEIAHYVVLCDKISYVWLYLFFSDGEYVIITNSIMLSLEFVDIT